MKMLDKIQQTIRKYSMLSEGDSVLTGLSGGPDSVCLTVVLNQLKNIKRLSLSAVYINHGLRPDETVKEVEFCKRFCEGLGIHFIERRADTEEYARERGMNIQEAARVLRYKIFSDTAEQTGASRIALGHNADDQAETVLMRLFRGAGRKGLAGIPPKRGKIIRPLIDTGRAEIEEFLEEEFQNQPEGVEEKYMTDSTNLEDKYLRNWIRLRLMDEVKKRNPSVVEDICRTADILREEDEYLELTVTKTLMRLISRKSDQSIELFLSPLGTIEKPLLRRVLRRAVNETRGLRRIAFVHIEDIMRLIKQGESGDRLDLPKGIKVIRDYSLLKITTEKPVTLGEHVLHSPGEILLEETGNVIKASVADERQTPESYNSVVLDADLIEFPLVIRARKQGDAFCPLGFGRKKKLQDFFVDEKVPRDRRDRVPIILSGNDIIWVAGYRADDRFRVTEKTKRFLRLEICRKHSNTDIAQELI